MSFCDRGVRLVTVLVRVVGYFDSLMRACRRLPLRAAEPLQATLHDNETERLRGRGRDRTKQIEKEMET